MFLKINYEEPTNIFDDIREIGMKRYSDLTEDQKKLVEAKGGNENNYVDILRDIMYKAKYYQINEGIDLSYYEKYSNINYLLINREFYPYKNSYREKESESKVSEYYVRKCDRKKYEIGNVFHGVAPHPNRLQNPYNSFKRHYSLYKFVIDIEKKYNLSNIQRLILSLNYDLLTNLYIQKRLNSTYENSNDILKIDIKKSINEYIYNLKSIAYEDIEKDLTMNSLYNLKDNFIFFTNIEKLLEIYSNTNIKDIVKLISSVGINDYNDLIGYLEIVNNLNGNDRYNLLFSMSNIFADTKLFPSIEKEKLNSQKETYIGESIVKNNAKFFSIYDGLFEKELNYEYLLSIKDNPNIGKILSAFAVLKKYIVSNIPEYKDTIESVECAYRSYHEPEMHEAYTEELPGYTTTHFYEKYVGDVTYGKEIIDAEKEIFSLIKEESLKPDFDFNQIASKYISKINDNTKGYIMYNILELYNSSNVNETVYDKIERGNKSLRMDLCSQRFRNGQRLPSK